MSFEIVALKEEHLEDAAALACRCYREFRAKMPLMPVRYGEPSTQVPLLQKIVKAGPAVAAIDNGRIVGFITAWLMPSFRGRRAVLSPEWGNAADSGNRRRIYEEMYTHISADWTNDGYLTHMIARPADPHDNLDLWHWLGFGMIAVDSVRDLTPLPNSSSHDIDIRLARSEDIADVATLFKALRRHSASAPTFLIQPEQRNQQYLEEWLANPDKAIWLAYDGSRAVAFMQQGPASRETCDIIVDEKTTSITAAYTDSAFRGKGIALELLNGCLEWGRSRGYERCAVDFEPMNPLAARFWSRHFKPVCFTLVRHLDSPNVAKEEAS